ncbi:trigger factor [Guggenheimella bovis]
MDYKVQEQEKSHVKIEYTVSKEEFEPFLEKAYQKTKNKYAIAGFRKGKVPRKMLEIHYGKDLFYDDALNMLIPDLYDESVEKLGLDPVAQPTFEMDSVDDDTLHFHANVAVRPEVKLGAYKDLKVEELDTTVTDEDVKKAVDMEREKNARITPVEREAQMGDILTIDFVGYIGDEAFEGGSAEGIDLELGSGQFIPGFEEQLVGAKKGDDKEVNVTFPEQYTEELRGKDARFEVKVQEVKAKELPEADDDFAGDISEFDTFKEFEEDLRKKLQEEKERTASNHRKDERMKMALEGLEVEIPEEMIDQEIDGMMNDFKRQMSMQGIKVEDYFKFTNSTEADMRNDMRLEATNRVKGMLLFEEVVKAEKLEVSEDELNEEVKRLATELKREEDEIRKIYSHDDYSYLKHNLNMKKAYDIVVGE